MHSQFHNTNICLHPLSLNASVGHYQKSSSQVKSGLVAGLIIVEKLKFQGLKNICYLFQIFFSFLSTFPLTILKYPN